MTRIKSATLVGGGPSDLRGNPDAIKAAVRNAVESASGHHANQDRFDALAPTPPDRATLAISDGEWTDAKLTPKCIVENHLYADVAQRVGPGGTGKTTLTLWETIHIILGMDLYGAKVTTPGWVLYITAEDPRERLVARTRAICMDMGLTPDQVQRVRDGLLFWDLTAVPAKLAMEADGNILQTPLAERIVERFKGDPPVLVEIDPTVSFGASEARVNDNEQALVLAARVLVKGLDCCVRYTHHTGKGNARDKTTDQYSGRGGSAMADGCRMVHVLQTWSEKDKGDAKPPATLDIGPQTGVITYTRAKMSHCPPNQPVIWVARNGFKYEWAEEHHLSPEQETAANADQVVQFLRSQLAAGRYHTQRSLEDGQLARMNMRRKDFREALAELEASGRVVMKAMPEHMRHGRRKEYLCPSDNPLYGLPTAAADEQGRTESIAPSLSTPGGAMDLDSV